MRVNRSTLWGVALLSCATLAYEVGLTRLYAVQQFYHFAFLVVSLAVMGMAASGLLLSLNRRTPPLPILAVGFSLAVWGSYLVLQMAPFDSYSIAWQPGQIALLGLDIAAAGAPFLLSGWVTAACLAQAASEARRPYAASLIGGALGGPLALAATDLAGAEAVVFLAGSLGLAAAATLASRPGPKLLLLAAAVGAVTPVVRLPPAWQLRISPYKPLALARLLPDARVSLTTWSASARLDIVESQAFHIFPGLSLNASVELPSQAGVFLDGEGPLPLTVLDPSDPESTALALAMPSGLGYALRPGAAALILRSGAGLEAALALAAGAKSVTVVVDEPLIHAALSGPGQQAPHGIAQDPRVTWVDAPQRSGLARIEGNFDLIVISLSEPYRPIRSGAFSLNDDYGLTVEALSAALGRLAPDGLLVLTRWLGTPPSDETRAWATLLEAAAAAQSAPTRDRVLAYRSMRTATLVASPRPFSPEELSAVRESLEANGYDPIFLPDLHPQELNRHNRLPQDVYHAAFTALMHDPVKAFQTAEMDIRPATDDHPFYFQFFRWRQIPDVLAQLGQTWQPFGGSGFLVLLLLLGITLSLAAGLVALAAGLSRRTDPAARPPSARSLIYFAAIGLGFLIVEVALIQQLGLLLDRPAFSLATVLAVLLLASGIGSLLSNRADLRWILPAIAMGTVAVGWLIPVLSAFALSWSLLPRVGLVAGVLFPLGMGMGIPFARGLQQLRPIGRSLMPWAWTANGAASGVAGVVSSILALSVGLKATLLIGAVAYLVAWLVLPRSEDPRNHPSGT